MWRWAILVHFIIKKHIWKSLEDIKFMKVTWPAEIVDKMSSRWTHWGKVNTSETSYDWHCGQRFQQISEQHFFLLAPYHCSKCYSRFYKRAKWQRRSRGTLCWFPFKCHYLCTANEIGTLWEQPSKARTMSVSVGDWRPCCGQSRSWRQTATCAVLILDTLQIHNGSPSRSGEARLHSNHLWSWEHHRNKKKASRGLLRNLICHFISILWHGRRLPLFEL